MTSPTPVLTRPQPDARDRRAPDHTGIRLLMRRHFVPERPRSAAASSTAPARRS